MNDDNQNINDSAQPEQPGETATEPEETTQEEVAKPEEASSDVIANETEGEVKQQSSSEENPTQIATEPEAPRDDEKTEPVATDEPTQPEQAEQTTDEPASEPEATEPAQETPSPAKNDNPNAKWYVVHTYSGHENKVAHTLKQRVESEHLEDKILEVLVPTQDKIEIKGGKKVNIKEKIFPGYILVKMVLDDVSWLAVRTTQGVTSFVGMGNKPTPISDAEVATIVKFTQTEAPMYKQVFMVSDTVKIVDGPFADFIGKIDSVDEERGKVRVLVSIFGRETPVELDFLQVQKL